MSSSTITTKLVPCNCEHYDGYTEMCPPCAKLAEQCNCKEINISDEERVHAVTITNNEGCEWQLCEAHKAIAKRREMAEALREKAANLRK